MELSTLSFLLVYALLALGLAILLPVTLVKNIRTSFRYRDKINQSLSRLRLHKMLTSLGIDVNRYLHKVPTSQIHGHMKACKQCDRTDQCDNHLSKPDTSHGQVVMFCSNSRSLQEFIEKDAA